MKKNIYTPIQWVILSFLLICSITLAVSDNPSRWEVSGNPCKYSYIHQGEYTLSISCTPVDKANRVIVYSDQTTNTDGEIGVILAEAELQPGQAEVTIPLSVENNIYSVRIHTDLDTNKNTLINAAYLVSTGIIYRDGVFLGVTCFVILIVLGIVFARIPRERYIMPLLAVIFGVTAGIPFYTDFILDGHDFSFHLSRLEGIYQAMAAGDFPVRLNPLQISGYGYLSSTMYPQMFLYPVALLRFFNVSIMTCYKVLLMFINIATALFAYYALKSITKSEKMGILLSFLYTFSAYRLVCMYVRCAIGECLAMAFFPLVVWGVYECLWGKQHWYILTFGLTGILGSHVLSVEMCALFMGIELIWWLFSKKKQNFKKSIVAGAKAVFVTLGLNFSFIVPLLYFSSQGLQCFQQINASANSVVYFSQMFSLFIGTHGTSVPRGTTVDDMSLTVGTSLFVGMLVFCFWAGSLRSKTKDSQGVGIHCAAYALVAIFLSSWLMPWGAIILRIPLIEKLTAALQFVWRFLGPASLFMAICTAVGLVKLIEEKKEWNWVAGVIITLTIITSWTLFDDLKEWRGQNGNPMEMEALIDVDQMYLYSGTDSTAYTRKAAVPRTVNDTSVTYSDYIKRGTNLSMCIAAPENSDDKLVLPLYYYPGYEIKVNGEKVDSYNADSLLACDLPSGQAQIQVRYAGLLLFRISDWVTLFAVLSFLGGILIKRMKRHGVFAGGR